VVSAHSVTGTPARAWPGQNCCLRSARFPNASTIRVRFGRTGNTGGDIRTEGDDQHQAAANRTFHDTTHRSCLILPVVERPLAPSGSR
jgi:hypothetical protein